MASSPQHIIQKQILTVNLDSQPERDASVLLQSIAQFGEEQLPKILDQQLSTQFAGEEQIYIDSLVIELEVDDPAQLGEAIKMALPKAFQEAVTVSKKAKSTSAYPVDLLPLFSYLKEGKLSWANSDKMTLAEVWAEVGIELHRCKLLKSSQPNQEWTTSELPSFITQAKLWRRWQADLLRWIALHRPAVKRWVRDVGLRPLYLLFQIQVFPDFNREQQQRLNEIYQEYFGRYPDLPTPDDLVNNLVSLVNPATTIVSGKTIQPKEITGATTKTDATTSIGSGDFITYAGLGIVHPFIVGFLEEQGVIVEKEITDHALAASLLFGLAAGRSPAAEWELSMAKFLLNIPFEEPLDLIELSEDQLHAAHTVLVNAIDHWTALGSTSPAGLRISYLQRKGKLIESDYGFTLLMEQEPYDMLLQELPWRLNFIRFPWMEQYLNLDFSR
ncbi:MAG: contractile injection system tape measure protein [Bacteroidota bacterium]